MTSREGRGERACQMAAGALPAVARCPSAKRIKPPCSAVSSCPSTLCRPSGASQAPPAPTSRPRGLLHKAGKQMSYSQAPPQAYAYPPAYYPPHGAWQACGLQGAAPVPARRRPCLPPSCPCTAAAQLADLRCCPPPLQASTPPNLLPITHTHPLATPAPPRPRPRRRACAGS